MHRTTTLKKGIRSQEEYFTKDESLRSVVHSDKTETQTLEYKVTTAQWIGPKSASLGLVGDVEQSKFVELLYGNLPGSNQRIRYDRKHGRQNLAVICVLSPPKSFSMHALVDVGLYEDHMEACRKTLAVSEERYCYQRKFVRGQQVNVNGDGFIACGIPHWTSRPVEKKVYVLLHTHLVIFNGVQGPDGIWRALDDRPFSYAEWQGIYYRRELSKLTQHRGYVTREVRLRNGSYSFEIEGISRSQIEHFSKRSIQIIEAAAARGLKRDDVVLLTREPKLNEKTWTEFRDDCVQEMKRLGIELQTPSLIPVKPTTETVHTVHELENAIQYLLDNFVSFRPEDLYKYALNHIQDVQLTEIDSAIAAHAELIHGDKLRRLTTIAHQKRATRTFKLWNKGKGAAPPIVGEKTALAALKGVGLNQGQAKAIAGVLSTSDQHLIIEGLGGKAKTTTLVQLKQISERYGADLKVSVYDSQQLDVQALLGMSRTIAQNQIWIMDKAGSIKPQEMETILTKADAIGARVLLVGDSQQKYSSVSGSAMRSLTQHGATTFSVGKNIQERKAIPKLALKLMEKGQSIDALSLLREHGYLDEIKNPETLTQRLVDEWLKLSKPLQKRTIIVAGSDSERLAVNRSMRESLRAKGILGEDQTFAQLVHRPLTIEEKQSVTNCRKGDYVQVISKSENVSLKQFQLYQVIEAKGEQLLVTSLGGRKYRFNPSQCNMEVFYEQPISIAVGDRLRWTATAADRNRDAVFKVKKIEGRSFIVTGAKGELKNIDGSKPLLLDYASVCTINEVDELKGKQFIFSASNSVSAQNLIKILNAGDLQIYTNNLEQLRSCLTQPYKQTPHVEVNHEPKSIKSSTHQNTSREHSNDQLSGDYVRFTANYGSFHKATYKTRAFNNDTEFMVARVQGSAVWIEDIQGQRYKLNADVFYQRYSELGKWVHYSAGEANPPELNGVFYDQHKSTVKKFNSPARRGKSDTRNFDLADITGNFRQQSSDREFARKHRQFTSRDQGNFERSEPVKKQDNGSGRVVRDSDRWCYRSNESYSDERGRVVARPNLSNCYADGTVQRKRYSLTQYRLAHSIIEADFRERATRQLTDPLERFNKSLAKLNQSFQDLSLVQLFNAAMRDNLLKSIWRDKANIKVESIEDTLKEWHKVQKISSTPFNVRDAITIDCCGYSQVPKDKTEFIFINGNSSGSDLVFLKSNHARSLSLEAVPAYLDVVQAKTPEYLEYKQQTAINKQGDRALYDAIASKIYKIFPDSSRKERDAYIWLVITLKKLGDGDQILLQSDSLKGKRSEQIKAYLSEIKEIAREFTLSLQEKTRSVRIRP